MFLSGDRKEHGFLFVFVSQMEFPGQVVLEREIQEFLVNREAQRLSPNTIEWYGYTPSILRVHGSEWRQ